jgi:hypothetical protein
VVSECDVVSEYAVVSEWTVAVEESEYAVGAEDSE